MSIAQSLLTLTEIQVIFSKIRQDLVEEIDNASSDIQAIVFGKYVNDLSCAIDYLKEILPEAYGIIHLKRKDFKKYDYKKLKNMLNPTKPINLSNLMPKLYSIFNSNCQIIAKHFNFETYIVKLDGTFRASTSAN